MITFCKKEKVYVPCYSCYIRPLITDTSNLLSIMHDLWTNALIRHAPTKYGSSHSYRWSTSSASINTSWWVECKLWFTVRSNSTHELYKIYIASLYIQAWHPKHTSVKSILIYTNLYKSIHRSPLMQCIPAAATEMYSNLIYAYYIRSQAFNMSNLLSSWSVCMPILGKASPTVEVPPTVHLSAEAGEWTEELFNTSN